MRSSPRKLPDRIDGYRSTVINAILDYLETLRPIDTRGVWHVWRPDGVETHVGGIADRASVAMPFDLASYSPDTKVLTLTAGDFEVHGETAAGTVTEYKAVSPLTVTLSASGTEYVWAELAWSGSAWGTPTLAKGTSKPQAGATTYRKLLWEFSSGAPVKQYHRGNIEFVGWRMRDS